MRGLAVLFGLFLAKLIATLATVGSGAVGGVFTPTLFLGAGLGGSFALLLRLMGAGEGLPIAPFAVVGMGSMLSATTRSPLLAMIMIFEISLDYSLMPALMLACVVSILVARRFHPEIHLYRTAATKGSYRCGRNDRGRRSHRTNGWRFNALTRVAGARIGDAW